LSGKGITIRTYNTGKSQLVGDTRKDPDFFKDIDPDEYLSELDVPVKIDGKVVAVINLEEREPHFFSEEDKEIVEILSEQIASAISRIQHHETIKVAEKALVKSEKRFKHILDSAPEGVTVNIRGKIVYVNKQFSKMIGYSVEELFQKDIIDLHKEAYKEQVLDGTKRRALGENIQSQYEVELEKKDGSTLPVEYSISSIVYDGERASLTFIRDVSHKKEKQLLQDRIAALHKHAHALNELRSLEDVAENTLQILHTHMNCNLLSIRSSDGENLTMLARWGEEPIGEPLPIQGKGLLARTAREKQTLLVNG
jgi:PAS domain S-box-containing protein